MTAENTQQGIHTLIKSLVEGILREAKDKTLELEKTVSAYVSESRGVPIKDFQKTYHLVNWYLDHEVQMIEPNSEAILKKDCWRLKNPEQVADVEKLTQEIMNKYVYWIKN